MQKTKKAPSAKMNVATGSKTSSAGRSKETAVSKAHKPSKKAGPAVQAAKKASTSVKKTVVVKKAAAKGAKGAGKKEAPKAAAKASAKESVKKAPAAKVPPKAAASKDSKKTKESVKAAPAEPKKEAAKGERRYAKQPEPKKADAKKSVPKDEIEPDEPMLDSDDLDSGEDEIVELKAASQKAASSASKARKNEVDKESSADDEVVLTDAEGRRYCRVRDCDQIASVDGGYCRYHYLLYWRNIQNRKKILSEGKLERYVEELTARYPDKFLELLRKDLRSEKDFMSAIQELEIDESGNDGEFEDEAQSYLDEVRGMGSEPSNDREEDF